MIWQAGWWDAELKRPKHWPKYQYPPQFFEPDLRSNITIQDKGDKGATKEAK
jgi:hypothetical protein